MNNSELLSQLNELVATNRFSQARKVYLSTFIGKEFQVSGILSQVRNTTGYLRRQELRKGKTITLRLAGCETALTIRCDRGRSTYIAEHNATIPFNISVTVTGYDDIRQQLESDELGQPQFNTATSVVIPNAMTDVDAPSKSSCSFEGKELLNSSSTDNQTDQLLAELEQMQSSSLNLLSEVENDIDKAQSRNVPLLVTETDDRTTRQFLGVKNPGPPEMVDQSGQDTNTSRPNANVSFIRQPVALEQAIPVSVESEIPETLETDEDLQQTLMESLRLGILSEQQDPIGERDFSQFISLTTGVAIQKVNEIQKELWRAVMNPSMFAKQREFYNFYPFGDFRMRRDRENIAMDFKSAPVTELAKHTAIENYPHSNFDGSDANSNHPPIATHAIQIAATVAPIVGLSLPVTYDVIFETLKLVLKIFVVGKRRVRFSDIGEFVPVLLGGTMQYHFRPYRQLIRFVTQSARAIVAVAEREGEAQLAFEANQGVPDRTTVQSRPRVKKDDEKKNNIGCMFIISIIVIYQVLKYLFG